MRITEAGTYEMDALPEKYELRSEANLHDQSVIKWSGKLPVPEIGQEVKLYVTGFGSGIVSGYFVEYGWLGVYVRLAKNQRPAWHKKQLPDIDHYMAFGIDLVPVSEQES